MPESRLPPESRHERVRPASEPGAWLQRWAHDAARRRSVRDGVRALVWSVPALAVPGLLLFRQGLALPWVVVLIVTGATALAAVWAAQQQARVPIGPALEAKLPSSRNLLHTALSLASATDRGAGEDPRADVLVLERAVAFARSVNLSSVFAAPLKPAVASVVATAVVFSLVVTLLPSPAEHGTSTLRRGPDAARDASIFSIGGVRVLVTPPAYLADRDAEYRDPSRITVPASARVTVTVSADGADSVILETSAVRTPLEAVDGAFRTTWRADADEVLAVQAHRGDAIARSFVGVQVVQDADPRVRVSAPGRDLVLPRGDTTLRLVVRADDDHALASLALRYTKVSGSGERYEFVEGTLPLRVARLDASRWEASADWALASLALQPGDVVVYRAVATDRRPGAPEVESDAWIAEVMTGRGDGAAGFAVDVGELRYALSQQMIVMRIERLLAARDSLGAALADDAFADRARNIAVEQRRVRAEFVFLLGGELSEEVAVEDNMGDLNEHQHTEVDADLSTGRVRNEGRQAVQAAIRAMSRAATTLADTALAPALQHARDAVTQLEIAFTRARFLMRPLAERERIDMTRRLTGALAGISSTVQPRSAPRDAGVHEALAAVLRTLLQSVERSNDPPNAAPRRQADAWQRLAGDVLRTGAADPETQEIALALNAAAEAMRRGEVQRAAGLRDDAAHRLTRLVASGAPAAVRQTRSARAAQFEAPRGRSTPLP
jgi:hypothetical protein